MSALMLSKECRTSVLSRIDNESLEYLVCHIIFYYRNINWSGVKLIIDIREDSKLWGGYFLLGIFITGLETEVSFVSMG